MAEMEVDVSEVVYAGPHVVRPDTYEIEVKVETSPGVPCEYITLRFTPAQATLLARMLQSNQPRAVVDGGLLERIAAHDT